MEEHTCEARLPHINGNGSLELRKVVILTSSDHQTERHKVVILTISDHQTERHEVVILTSSDHQTERHKVGTCRCWGLATGNTTLPYITS